MANFDEIGRGDCPSCHIVKPRDSKTLLCRDCFEANEVTSPEVGTAAAKLLADPETPPEVKSVAASALTQRPDHHDKDHVAAAYKAAKKHHK